MNFLLCLQFWEGDKAKAMRLARFIADIEPKFRADVEFIFVARYDCDHDHDTIRYVNEKFRVNWITTKTWWRGWPAGPNAMAKDVLEWLSVNRRESGGALLFEPDCAPTHPKWLDILITEWKAQPTMQMGAWRASGGPYGHLNGNAIFPTTFAKALSLEIIGPDLAWDVTIAPYIRREWRITQSIRNCFESYNAKNEDLTPGKDGPFFVHGFKDDSAYHLARRLCGLEAHAEVRL